MELYEQYLRGQPSLMARIAGLTGALLVCRCAPGQPCHGDVMIRLWRVLPQRSNEEDAKSLWQFYQYLLKYGF